MTEEIVARDIMRTMFLRVSTDHTLRETLGVLLDPQGRRDQPRVLVVLNPDGSFAGLVSLRDLLKAFAPEWPGEPGEGAEDFDRRLLDALQARLDTRIVAAMNPRVPVASPADRLARLVELMQPPRIDAIPVMDNGRVVGIVHLADLFAAVARLALSSQA